MTLTEWQNEINIHLSSPAGSLLRLNRGELSGWVSGLDRAGPYSVPGSVFVSKFLAGESNDIGGMFRRVGSKKD